MHIQKNLEKYKSGQNRLLLAITLFHKATVLHNFFSWRNTTGFSRFIFTPTSRRSQWLSDCRLWCLCVCVCVCVLLPLIQCYIEVNNMSLHIWNTVQSSLAKRRFDTSTLPQYTRTPKQLLLPSQSTTAYAQMHWQCLKLSHIGQPFW
jgi:hypothetical protein